MVLRCQDTIDARPRTQSRMKVRRLSCRHRSPVYHIEGSQYQMFVRMAHLKIYTAVFIAKNLDRPQKDTSKLQFQVQMRISSIVPATNWFRFRSGDLCDLVLRTSWFRRWRIFNLREAHFCSWHSRPSQLLWHKIKHIGFLRRSSTLNLFWFCSTFGVLDP